MNINSAVSIHPYLIDRKWIFRSFCLELSSANKPASSCDMTTNINHYNSKLNIENINGNSKEALWSWFEK